LLLGVRDAQGQLVHAGKVGAGFDNASLLAIRKALDAIARRTSPFTASAEIEARPHWVKPTLVAEVSFGEWTRDGLLRHAVFRSLRSDKPARDIVREHAVGGVPRGSRKNPP